MATIDEKGGCLISDVTTANYRFHVELGKYGNLISKVFFLFHSDSIIKFLAISISLTSLNSIRRFMWTLQMEYQCGRITNIREVRPEQTQYPRC